MPGRDPRLRVERQARGPRVAVARLPNRARIDQIPPRRIERYRVTVGHSPPHLDLLRVEGEGAGDMRVAEQNDAPLRRAQGAKRLLHRQHIGVLVVRRAVTDDELVVDRHRPLGELPHVVQVLPAQVLGRPKNRQPCRRVEPVIGLDPRDHLVVIAADRHSVRRQGTNGLDNLVRPRTVTDQIAEHQDAIVVLWTTDFEDRLERRPVGVHV